MATRPFPAVGGTGREACVAFSANLLVAVVFRGEHLQRGFDDAAAETGDMGRVGK